MKILIINTYYYPNMIGGTENSVKLLAENLQSRENEVAIYSADSNSNMLEIDEFNKVKIYRGNVGKYDLIAKMNKSEDGITKFRNKLIELNNISAREEIKKVLDDFKPDVIHTNNLFGISNIIWKIAKKEYNIPVIHTLRDYWMLYPIVSKEKLSKILFQPFMKERTKYVDVVTAPSKYTLNKFVQAGYFEKSFKICVPNAINLNIEETKKIINNRKNNNSEKIKFMYVGMLTENKGIRNLLQAFNENKNENITLNIYGKGILENFVKQKENEDKRIKYYGQLTAENLRKEWIKNDVLIIPSIWEEPFGRVVIEANQYGLPVIGANRAGILEIINNINTGITYQYDSIIELNKAIKYFSNRNNIKKYYDAIEQNIEKYSVEKQIEEFSKLYNRIKNVMQ